MALAETAELAVKLTLGGNFLRQMGQVNKQLKGFDKEASRAYRAGQQIGTGIKRGAAIAAGGIALLASQVALGLDSLVELEKATAQTEAVIKSTGGTAGVTADEVRKLAEKYEALNATVGDEVIQAGENLLLTFTAVRKDAFEPALQAALDLSVALGTDLDAAIKTVGKALSEPDKAMARLRRQGIILTKAEEKQIQAHLDNNDALGAQNVILKALDKRYGNSFLAGGSTTAGKVAKFKDSIEDLQRALATALLPAVGNIADALSDLLQDPEIIKGAEDLGREIGKLFSRENVKEGARLLGQVFDTLKSAAPAIKTALGTVGTVLKTAFDAFTSLPEPIQQLLIGGFAVNKLTGGLVTNIAGGVFGALKAMTVQAGVVNVTGGLVNGGGLPGAAVGAGAKTGVVSGLLKATIVGAVVVAGWEGMVTAIEGFAAQNQEKADKGLNRAEIAAVNYYGADKQTQSLIYKRLGYIPEKADADSGNAKLAGGIASLKEQANRTKDDTIAATNTVKAAQLETKRETTKGAALTSQATRTGSAHVVSAIYANRPIITTIVNVSATSVTKEYTVNKRYGSSGGSRDHDRSDE